MRWSQIIVLSSVFVSGVLHGVSALPTNLNPRSDIDPTGTQLFARKLKAGELKEDSKAVRAKALSNGHMYDKTRRGVKKVAITAMPAKGHTQADHILEAQTVVKALHNAGHTKKLTKAQKTAVMDALNHHENLIHVHKDINSEKNHFSAAVLNQKSHVPTSHLKDYMSHTKDNGLKAAHAVDAALKQHGIHNVDVHGLHKQLLAHAGVHRRELLDVDDN